MAALPALLLLLVAAVLGADDIEVTPLYAVRQIGEELNMLCKVSYPISYCRVEIGKESFFLTPQAQQRAGEPVYHGKGLEVGECGARISNIKDQWNGNVTCTVPPAPNQGAREVKGIMKLTVARAPGNPELITSPGTELREGETFTARCRVPGGRPAANILWFLGDQPLLNGLERPVYENATAEGLVDVSQVVSRILTADDDRRDLVCRAEHPALRRPTEAKRQLDVQYPPRRVDGSTDEHITIFGLKLQEEGRINVTIRANPAPHVEWLVTDVSLIPGSAQSSVHNENSIWTALEPLRMPQDHGSGYYNITLVLSPVTKEDVDRNYLLKLSNRLGDKNLKVQLSTLDEPAGVELDAGAIVGIVVGVLVLLLAVFLVVFAKATDRWCFAGSRGRDHTKSSGESDTESAVGGAGGGGAGGARPSRLAGLQARVRAVLPRGKDRVQATEPQTDKPLAEEKKGVVYAELALGEQTADKPQPPSTEYAEIVYTEQPKETKE